MSKHTVHKSTETGNFVVADDKGNILHTFPSEGEANLQVLSLDQAEKEAKEAEKAEAKEEHKAEAKNAKHDDDEGKSHGRHR
jgi:hypothetical protein